MDTVVNQRDAQKLATRRALSKAAIDLFTTNGFDETRVEDIATAAGVTARTFFLHFPSKEDAAFPDHAERVAVLGDVLAAEEPGTDTLPTLRDVIVLGISNTTNSRIRARRRRLFQHIDALRARDVLGDLDYEEVITAHLVERGRSPFDARRIAVSVMGIARAALTVWVDDPAFDPAAAARHALEQVH